MQFLFKYRIPLYIFLIPVALFLSLSVYSKYKKKQTLVAVPGPIVSKCPDDMKMTRLPGYKLIHPLIMADIADESAEFNGIKRNVSSYINDVVNSQHAKHVSVYFRRMNDGSWFSINENETYNPASLSKMIYLLTYLKEASIYPSILKKKILFREHLSNNVQNIKSVTMTENTYYSVEELLVRMIANSDNEAVALLSQNVNPVLYKNLFTDLQINSPPTDNGEYFISPIEMSKFFQVLYNGTYIGPKLSEFGLEVLTHCDYKNGIIAGLDSSIVVAHKFGERVLGNTAQLHEFGIVYFNNSPYLIGVMSSGNNLNELAEILKHISMMVYQYNSGSGGA